MGGCNLVCGLPPICLPIGVKRGSDETDAHQEGSLDRKRSDVALIGAATNLFGILSPISFFP